MTMEELKKLARQYVENKNEADSYKKLCEEENATLKKAMEELGVTEVDLGMTKIVRSVSNRVTLDEDKVLDILRFSNELPPNNSIIRTKEYVDMAELEKAIYAGILTSETVVKLDAAKITSPDIVTLRVVKAKEKK